MIYVYKDRIINVEWTVLKGTSTVKENFDRALVKLFLIGPHEKFLLKANAKDGIVSAEVPQGLPEGVYSVEIIYIKNWLGVDRPPKMPDRFPIDCRGNDRCIMRSRKDNLFAITEYESEATEIGEGEVVIRVKTSTASYGYDGLSAYEIAVLRGDFEGTEGEWLEWTHERIVTDVKDLLDKLKSRDTRFVVKTQSQRDNLKDLREGDEVYVIDDGIAYILETENGKRTWKPCDYGTVTSKYILSLIAGMPGFVADRAIADEFGKRIVDEYLTRDAVRNYMNEVFNDLFVNNPPTIMDGMITVDMLSDAVKQLIGFGPIVNFPDDEFLTTKGGRITPKDRNYDPNNYSGMGRKILRKNMVNGVNVLTQKMMSCPNTVYVITYDYSLRGQTITVPENCVLQFEGGLIRNGTIQFNGTMLEGNINIQCTLEGTLRNSELNVSWFNVIGDGTTDVRLSIQQVFNVAKDGSTVLFPRTSNYYKVIIGTGTGSTIVAQRASAVSNGTLYPITVSKNDIDIVIKGVIKSTNILGDVFELTGNNIRIKGEGGKIQGVGGADSVGFLDTNTSDTTLQWHPCLVKVKGDNCRIDSLLFEDYPTHGIDCYGKAIIVDSCVFIGGRIEHSTTGGTVLMGIRTNTGADSAIMKNNRFIANSKGGKCYSCMFPSGDRFIISNNICEKYHEHAVYAYGNYGNIFNNRFTDVDCIASDIQYFATYGNIKGNYSIGTEGFIQVMHGKGTIIECNIVTGCRGGIIVRPYHTVDVDKLPSGLKITNNFVELSKGTTGSCLSFYILGEYDISDILINGNTFSNGYYIQDSRVAASLLIGAGSSENNGLKFLRVENNVIKSGRGALSWLKGIHNSIFKNNKFISESIDGVASSFTSAINANYVTDTIFEGNEFIDTKEVPTMARIIQLNTGTKNLTVAENNIINYTSNIYLDYDTDAKQIYKRNNRRNYLPLAGTYEDKPNAYAQEYGVGYYDKDNQIPMWWSGIRWKDAEGCYIVLSKSDINTPNKIYKIRFNIDLGGATLTLPPGCTLDFQGGSFSNGTIVGNGTKIEGNVKIECLLLGTYKGNIDGCWFIHDTADNTDELQNFFDLLSANNIGFFSRKVDVKISSSINVKSNTSVDFENCFIYQLSNSAVLANEARSTTYDNINISISNLHMYNITTNVISMGAIIMRGVKNLKIENFYYTSNVTPPDPKTRNWALTISGIDIYMNNINIDNYITGIWSDGIHFEYVKDLILTNFNIKSGDDCIAINPQDTADKLGGYLPNVNSNIVISNGICASNRGNILRIGAGGDTISPDYYVENVTVNNITVTGEGTNPLISLQDFRTVVPNNLNNNILISNIRGTANTTNDTKTIAIEGTYLPVIDYVWDNIVFENLNITTEGIGTRIRIYNAVGIVFKDCTINLKGDTEINSYKIFSRSTKSLVFKGCTINSNQTTGCIIGLSNNYGVSIDHCNISNYNETNTSIAIMASDISETNQFSESANDRILKIQGCIIERVGSTLMMPTDSVVLFGIGQFKDNILINAPNAGSTILNHFNDLYCGVKDIILLANTLSAITSVKGLRLGTYTYDLNLHRPKFAGVNTDNTITYYDAYGYTYSRVRGSTDQRPSLTYTDAGFQFYDNVLKKTILWNGTAWTNLDGTSLP